MPASPAVGDADDSVIDQDQGRFGIAPAADRNPEVSCPARGGGDVLETAGEPAAVGVEDLKWRAGVEGTDPA